MEAAQTLPFATVHTRGDHEVVIDGLRVDDDALTRLVREREDHGDNPDGLVRDALAIGARVLDRELVGAQTEVVKAEFEALKGSLTERTAALANRMDEKVLEVFGAEDGEFAKLVARHFGDESADAVQHRVRAVMGEVAKTMREDLRRELLSDGEDNPLLRFHKVQLAVADQAQKRHGQDMQRVGEKLEAMRLEVERLRAEREKLADVAAEAERGTAKGRSYEEAVYEAIDDLACRLGDDCEAVGDVGGAGGRKGDVVVALEAAGGPARGRIVFEAKNSKLSKNVALAELDQARETRSGDYAVLVVPSLEKLPARTNPLREYNGDKLLVVFDPDDGVLALEVGYQLARARVLMHRGEATGVDAEAVRTEVEKALSQMEAVRRVKQRLTAATTAIGEGTEVLDAMAVGVRAQLAQIENLLDAAGDEAA